jgi:stage II sporulation protein D
MCRVAIVSVLALATAGCLSPPNVPEASVAIPRSVKVQVNERGITAVREMPLETYVRAAALSEFSPAVTEVAAVEPMLEVQALISRTYAVSHMRRHGAEGFDMCATTHCQLVEPQRLESSRWSSASAEAVAKTAGLVLLYDGQPIQALFHSDCGGHTSTASAVWGGVDRPYLIARPDTGAAREAHKPWTYAATLSDVSKALNSDSRTSTGGDVVRIEIASRDDGGRAEHVTLESRGASSNRVVRGDIFRQVLTRAFGARALRSTRFDIRQQGAAVTFSGRGFGHGVGLCQVGARARLSAGATPEEVIRHYYPGAVIGRSPDLSSSWHTRQR